MSATATVVAADEHQVHVLCPYCHEVHHHGAGGEGGYRAPHCRVFPPPPDYLIADPHGLTGAGSAR